MKISMTKIIVLSISLLFTPFLNYSMAFTGTQTSTTSHEHQNISSSEQHHTTLGQDEIKHCSISGDHGKCNHESNEQCSTSCCVSIVLLSTTSQIFEYSFIFPNYYNSFMQRAESINIDNQLRPPQFA